MVICKNIKCDCNKPLDQDYSKSVDDWFNNHTCRYLFREYASSSVLIRTDFGYYDFYFNIKYNYYSIYEYKDKLKTIKYNIKNKFDKEEKSEYFIDFAINWKG